VLTFSNALGRQLLERKTKANSQTACKCAFFSEKKGKTSSPAPEGTFISMARRQIFQLILKMQQVVSVVLQHGRSN